MGETAEYRVIIYGAKDIEDYEWFSHVTDVLISRSVDEALSAEKQVCIVVTAEDDGASRMAKRYAKDHKYWCRTVDVEENRHCETARKPIRNLNMTEDAHKLIAFWDGKDDLTRHMIRTAVMRNMLVWIVPHNTDEDMTLDMTEKTFGKYGEWPIEEKIGSLTVFGYSKWKKKDNGRRGSATSIGDIGEEFVIRRIQELLPEGETAVDIYSNPSLHNEGGDFFLLTRRSTLGIKAPAEGHSRHTVDALTAEWHSFGVEVKTIDNFVTRNNNNKAESGTPDIDLFENPESYGSVGGIVRMMDAVELLPAQERSQQRMESQAYDSFPGLADHDSDLVRNAINTVIPGMIVYVLLDGKKNPFACIVFRPAEAFLERLREVGRGMNLTIEAKGVDGIRVNGERLIDLPRTRNNKISVKRSETGLIIYDNIWYVPLDRLEDLATVYIIDNMPDIGDVGNQYYASERAIENGWIESDEIQKNRIRYLRRLAGGKVIYYRTDPHAASME